MKFLGKYKRFSLYLLSLCIRLIVPIKRGRVLFWSTDGKDYGCNPMYISKYIVESEEDFDVWWMFQKDAYAVKFARGEKIVLFGTLRYLFILNSSEFLITNHRTYPRGIYWKKKRIQKYIMTWHGSMPIKKVEKDALETIGDGYENFAKLDSLNADLMISDSKWFSNLLRNSFWYAGEIIKGTIPRNTIFFAENRFQEIRNKVLDFFSIDTNSNIKLILYAPTFRTDHSVSSYITDWTNIERALRQKYGCNIKILMRLHPTLLNEVDTNELIKNSYVFNASVYNDMQELMVASDILITDYSSTMFEFSLMKKPCFLYMPDRISYDRGFYFKIEELPFMIAENLSALIDNMMKYDEDAQYIIVQDFVNKEFGLYKQNNGSKMVVSWMSKNRYKNG